MSSVLQAPEPRMRDDPSARILVVDDEEANLRLLLELLHREGHTDVVATPDPREVLPLLESLRPDLVLLDLHMPGMDGYAVMRQIRQSPAAQGYLPILMLTADATGETRQRALASGATDFVLKPFDTVEVTLRIRNLLETRRLHTAVRAHNADLELLVRERTRELEEALVRAEAAHQAKVQFLAKMSHELRTPLNPIRGVLELLREAVPQPSLRLVEMASRNVDRMAGLVEDILYLQSLEQGGVRPDPYRVHLASLVGEVAESMQSRVRAHGALQLRLEAAPEVPVVRCDPVLLAEVLTRLVDNAIRFTPQGEVVLRVTAAPDPDGALLLEVQDTGVGIAPEQLQSIFAPFEQADNSSTRRYEGAGLGLAICRAVCQVLHCELEVESQPGRGSTFRVVVPTVAE